MSDTSTANAARSRIARLGSSVPAAAVRWAVWVLLAWLVIAGATNLAVPQLERVVATNSTPFVPNDAPSVHALTRMNAAFGDGRSKSLAASVFTRDSGLTAADRSYIRSRVARLAADPTSVSFVQRVDRRSDLFDALTSHDGKAVYVQVGLPSATGAPTSLQEIDRIRQTVSAGRPAGLHVAVTGLTPTVADLFTEINHSLLIITGVTVVLIALLLLVLYRSVAITGVVLGQIGISLAVARAAVAWCGEHLFRVSTFTASLLTVVVLGAATDYAVFLIGRYQEARAAGLEPADAARTAGRRVGGVVIGSALTVVVASVAMAFGHISFFSTVGPAIAVGVTCALAIAISLTPAVMAMAGRRGLLEPRVRRHAGRVWPALAAAVTRRPGVVLVTGLVPLLALAAFYPALSRDFDERVDEPGNTQSNAGYRALDAHYSLNEVLPDFVVVTANHDMRTVSDLAALEKISGALADQHGVAQVRGITRPLGKPLQQATLGYRDAIVGSRLHTAKTKVDSGTQALVRLAQGSSKLASGAEALATGSTQLATGATTLAGATGQVADGASKGLTGARRLHGGLVDLRAGAVTASAGARSLHDGAGQLADGLADAHRKTAAAVSGLGQVLDALRNDPVCTLDPVCSRARDTGLARVYAAERSQLLPGLSRARGGADRLTAGLGTLDTGLSTLTDGLRTAGHGSNDLVDGEQTLVSALGRIHSGADTLAARTHDLSGGAATLAEGADAAQQGSSRATGAFSRLSDGLGKAVTALRAPAATVKDPDVGGFYLPPSTLHDRRLAVAAGLYLSADGRTARIFVLGTGNPFDQAAVDRAARLAGVAHDAAHDTTLADAEIDATGTSSIIGDLQRFADHDFLLVAIIALLAVLLILIVMLRSLIAPLFLIASVGLSYAAAMGLGVLVWQVLLHRPLNWTVPIFTFILLVAVGADYNLLLMKRVREDAPDGARSGVAAAVMSTARVITTAGLIFAASMFALLSGSARNLAQIGFTLGAGLLLDTFIVRSMVVPAIAALLGPRMWWPSRRREPPRPDRVDIAPDRTATHPTPSPSRPTPGGAREAVPRAQV